MSLAEVVPFTGGNIADVSLVLRNLADSIDRGEYGDAHNVAYVVDCGDSRISVGLAGRDAAPGATCHFLFACGMRKLTQNVT